MRLNAFECIQIRASEFNVSNARKCNQIHSHAFNCGQMQSKCVQVRSMHQMDAMYPTHANACKRIQKHSNARECKTIAFRCTQVQLHANALGPLKQGPTKYFQNEYTGY